MSWSAFLEHAQRAFPVLSPASTDPAVVLRALLQVAPPRPTLAHQVYDMWRVLYAPMVEEAAASATAGPAVLPELCGEVMQRGDTCDLVAWARVSKAHGLLADREMRHRFDRDVRQWLKARVAARQLMVGVEGDTRNGDIIEELLLQQASMEKRIDKIMSDGTRSGFAVAKTLVLDLVGFMTRAAAAESKNAQLLVPDHHGGECSTLDHWHKYEYARNGNYTGDTHVLDMTHGGHQRLPASVLRTLIWWRDGPGTVERLRHVLARLLLERPRTLFQGPVKFRDELGELCIPWIVGLAASGRRNARLHWAQSTRPMSELLVDRGVWPSPLQEVLVATAAAHSS